MRLFAAVVPPPDALAALACDVDAARAGLGPEERALRWAPPDRWHLTLAFYGEVDDPDPLSARLARAAARSRPMSLALHGAGRFGRGVLWAGVAGDVEELVRLAARCAAAGRREGVDVEDRAYRPHLTVARTRRPVDLRPAVELLAHHGGPVWPADRLHLVVSELGSEPHYRDVASWPLGTRSEPLTTLAE
ncbi:MAG: RNA 2',3'-cyclic phosphodiesterase [Motilibacteraceae bacterium]